MIVVMDTIASPGTRATGPLAAVAALARVARIVPATHERDPAPEVGAARREAAALQAPSSMRILRLGALLRLESQDVQRLSCLRGRLWVTVSGDLRDHFLVAGESLDCPAGRRVLVEADRAPAALRISAG